MSEWSILLIGGTSGVGKSVVSRVLARRFELSLGQVDDFRMVLQSLTDPDLRPELHFFISRPGTSKEGIWRNDPAVLCRALIKVSEVMSQALQVVVAHHIAAGSPLLLEGDAILPSLASLKVHKPQSNTRQIRSIFLEESDEEFFFRSAKDPESEEWTRIRTHWLYGKWLIEEAGRANLPVIPSRPWATLPDRIGASLQ